MEQRRRIGDLLDESPSLRPQVASWIKEQFPHARKKAAEEMKVAGKNFPAECPFTPEQVINEDFFPE